jgi:hypothetical protein
MKRGWGPARLVGRLPLGSAKPVVRHREVTAKQVLLLVVNAKLELLVASNLSD